jgi:hypothetical protein
MVGTQGKTDLHQIDHPVLNTAGMHTILQDKFQQAVIVTELVLLYFKVNCNCLGLA